MGFVDDEVLDGVITGKYFDSAGKCVEGIYKTVSEKLVVVDIGVIEELLSGAGVDDAVKQYLENQRAEKEKLSLENRRKAALNNLTKAHASRSLQKEEKQAHILRAMLRGYKKSDIVNLLGISQGTVDRTIKELNAFKVNSLYDAFGERGT